MPTSKTDLAYQALKQAILDGSLQPDEALTTATLQERYGLGWTPLRDALSRLEGENLVTLQRNKGYRVAGASHAELLDLQRARLTVEAALLRDSIRDGDEEWMKRVLLAHRTLANAPALEQGMLEAAYDRWEIAHQDFHLTLISGSRSLWLGRFAAQLHAQVRRHQRLVVLGKRSLVDARADAALSAILQASAAIEPHTRLMDAALDRDEVTAMDLLREHIGPTLHGGNDNLTGALVASPAPLAPP